jgi:hypothetical protein
MPARRRYVPTCVTLDWLNEYGGNLVGGDIALEGHVLDVFEAAEIAVWVLQFKRASIATCIRYMKYPRDKWAVMSLHRGIVAAETDGAHTTAVVTAGKAQYQRLSGYATYRLDGVVIRQTTRLAPVDLLGAGAQHLFKPTGKSVRLFSLPMNTPFGLSLHRLNDAGVIIAGVGDATTRDKVNEDVTVGVLDVYTTSLIDEG